MALPEEVSAFFSSSKSKKMQPTFVKSNEPSFIQVPDSLSAIATMIRKNWKEMHFSAVPYVQAMFRLTTLDDSYGADNAEEIVQRFLGNAQTWRGETAKAVKDKLRAMLKARK